MNGIEQVSSPIFLVPAYGRRYSTVDDMYTDFVDGKDFQIAYGPYTSIRDLEQLAESASSIWLVYGNLSVQVG